MAETDAGIIITQSGVPVRGAADYQKVYDSRWKFLEIAFERDVSISLPAVAGVATFNDRYYEKTTIFEHNLGFIPLFETNIPGAASLGSTGLVWADKKQIFYRRTISTGGQPAETVTGKLRIYNLAVLESYEAPKDFAIGTSSPRSQIGVKFLDGSNPAIDIEDRSPIGFSVDTTKKILSIHRHGRKVINEAIGRLAKVTAIDTATEILTLTGMGAGFPYPNDISWFSTVGAPVTYLPGDFVTYPGGISASTTYYLIPQTSTTVKLASSRANALAGTAINITSGGSLPGRLTGIAEDENNIYHGVGYPPTFLLAQTNWEDAYFPMPVQETEEYIGPVLENPPTFMRADKDNLSFFGVQSVFYGIYGYVILKDPAEIAG